MTISVESNFEQAYAEFSGKVRTFAKNSAYLMPGYAVEDMEQELLEVLWRTVEGYDPSRGATFNTLFQRNASNRIISLQRHFNTQSRKAEVVSFDDEEFRAAIELYLASENVEETVLMRIQLEEIVAERAREALQIAS